MRYVLKFVRHKIYYLYFRQFFFHEIKLQDSYVFSSFKTVIGFNNIIYQVYL